MPRKSRPKHKYGPENHLKVLEFKSSPGFKIKDLNLGNQQARSIEQLRGSSF
jgi:hypothetical protein